MAKKGTKKMPQGKAPKRPVKGGSKAPMPAPVLPGAGRGGFTKFN